MRGKVNKKSGRKTAFFELSKSNKLRFSLQTAIHTTSLEGAKQRGDPVWRRVLRAIRESPLRNLWKDRGLSIRSCRTLVTPAVKDHSIDGRTKAPPYIDKLKLQAL